MIDVAFHRSRRNAETIGDFFRRKALYDECENLMFSAGQMSMLITSWHWVSPWVV
jgi:hypothetical protein